MDKREPTKGQNTQVRIIIFKSGKKAEVIYLVTISVDRQSELCYSQLVFFFQEYKRDLYAAMEGSGVKLPAPIFPERSPELEKRCQKLRIEQVRSE